MAWYADLAPCDYFRVAADSLKAIGWLAADHDYPRGRVDHKVYLRLARLAKDPWEPFVYRGLHDCELCQYDPQTGYHNLFIPASSFLYVCPELILHYMNSHGYRPPEEFCEAVLVCPDMGTPEYRRQFLKAGGRALIQESRRGTTEL